MGLVDRRMTNTYFRTLFQIAVCPGADDDEKWNSSSPETCELGGVKTKKNRKGKWQQNEGVEKLYVILLTHFFCRSIPGVCSRCDQKSMYIRVNGTVQYNVLPCSEMKFVLWPRLPVVSTRYWYWYMYSSTWNTKYNLLIVPFRFVLGIDDEQQIQGCVDNTKRNSK